MMEAGVKDYDVALWIAYVMPAGTPDAIVGKLNREMRAILSDADTVETLQKQGFEPDARPARRGHRAHPERNREVARAGGEDRHQAGVASLSPTMSSSGLEGGRSSTLAGLLDAPLRGA